MGGGHRAPPGLSPSRQPASSFLALEASAKQSFMLSGGTRDPDLDNMDTFATASAVAAGVLDMGGDGGSTAAAVPPDQWETALDAGAGGAEGSRHGRSFSVPSSYFGQSRDSPRAVSGAPHAYGEQEDLAIGGGGVFDRALEQGRYAHQQGGRACRAPAGTVGGSGGVGFDAGRGSRLGLYMSSPAGNGGDDGGGAQEALPAAVQPFEAPQWDSNYFGGSPSSGAVHAAGGRDVLGFKKGGDHKH